MASKVKNVISYVKIASNDNTAIAASAYGICETPAATVAKEVDMSGFVLTEGVSIHVKFTNTNTAANPTLNVNGTGAKAIKRYGTVAPQTTTATSWQSGSIVSFTFDGSYWQMNDYIDTLHEADLLWGGKNFTSSYGCIDAALMDELGANRFQFIKGSAIIVEYSRDAGATWADYGATDAQKQAIFAQGGTLLIGKADSTNKATAHGGTYQLRITIDTGVGSIYSVLNKFVIYCSTNGSANCSCHIQAALQSTPTTFVNVTGDIPIGGWSGYNVLNISGLTTYGNTPSSQYGRVRFIFKDGTGGNTNYNGLIISQIKAFGGVGWTTPSQMAKTGHLYRYDENQNAFFPAKVSATSFEGNATSASKLNTNAGSATNPVYFSGGVPASCTYSLNKTVPSDAVFTDTNYYHKTGTWSGLTYTAGKVGSPNDLAFTIPTGTTASTVAVGNHTHSYAGSSAAGGSANSAVKLDSNAGSATNPIYFSGGKPATCTYSLNKTVPSDAVFTDTNKYHKSGSWSGLKYTATAVNSAEELSFTIPTGTSGTTVAAGNHTHTTTIASSTGTNQITLAHGGKYAITAGGNSYIFTMPASGNTDEKVKQTNTTSNTSYRVILSSAGNDTEATAQVYKSSNLIFNPDASQLLINGGGTMVITDKSISAGDLAGGEMSIDTSGHFQVGRNLHIGDFTLEGYHVEGSYNTVSGNYSHAEGGRASNEGNLASGQSCHAEGLATTASGNASHAEGGWNLSSGSCSHTDGCNNTASGDNSHAECRFCLVTGDFSHAEGWYTTCIGKASHSEGYQTCAYGANGSDADAAHAEGYQCTASGQSAHAEGFGTRATKTSAHAEGYKTQATGTYAHSEGDQTKATGSYGHSEGYRTYALESSTHAEGYGTTSNAQYSHSSGAFTSADNPSSTAIGHWNYKMVTGGGVANQTGTAFVIGNGTEKNARSNAFSVQFDGTVKAANTITANTTADYAEMFEWYDENPNDEDRVGYFITFEDGNKIRIVNNENDYILGISSGDPFVLGNGDCDYWTKLELRDDFNRVIYEPAQKTIIDEETGEFVPVYDEDGNPVYEGTRPKYNPDYDPTRPYISRLDRKEWQAVGMLGVLRVRQDGTLIKNGYCTIDYSTGKATFIDHYNKNDYIYRVIDVINDDVAEVVFK